MFGAKLLNFLMQSKEIWAEKWALEVVDWKKVQSEYGETERKSD